VNDNCNFDDARTADSVSRSGRPTKPRIRFGHSEACSALLVSAERGNRSLTTTDLAGAAGDDRGDYMAAFGGTSAAAPVVSGVVALMLARNPTLTWRDVQHILVRSSRKVDAGDPGWTAGVFSHSETRPGVVDAQAAVSLAATWTSVAAEAAIPEAASAVGLAIPITTRRVSGPSRSARVTRVFR
jgi:subtilisin family serine protease